MRISVQTVENAGNVRVTISGAKAVENAETVQIKCVRNAEPVRTVQE